MARAEPSVGVGPYLSHEELLLKDRPETADRKECNFYATPLPWPDCRRQPPTSRQRGHRMALKLPDPTRDHLDRSPLSLVVCQVRHENNFAVGDPKRALAVHDAISSDFPVLEEQSSQDLTIAAGPTGVQAVPGSPSRGWRMKSKEEDWTAVLMPDAFALETTNYETWDHFRGRFVQLVDAVAASVEPSIEQRIGVRMIDRISHPDVSAPADWAGLIDEAFLGPLGHNVLGEGVIGTQQVVQIDGGDGRSVLLRHGCFRDQETDGRWAYMLDHDCFIQRGVAFDVDSTLAEVEALHTLALQVFQQVITGDLFGYLRGGS